MIWSDSFKDESLVKKRQSGTGILNIAIEMAWGHALNISIYLGEYLFCPKSSHTLMEVALYKASVHTVAMEHACIPIKYHTVLQKGTKLNPTNPSILSTA